MDGWMGGLALGGRRRRVSLIGRNESPVRFPIRRADATVMYKCRERKYEHEIPF